jgi:hypothetical protein
VFRMRVCPEGCIGPLEPTRAGPVMASRECRVPSAECRRRCRHMGHGLACRPRDGRRCRVAAPRRRARSGVRTRASLGHLSGLPQSGYTRWLTSCGRSFVHPLRPSSASAADSTDVPHRYRCLQRTDHRRTAHPGWQVGGDAVALIRLPASAPAVGVSSLRLDPGACLSGAIGAALCGAGAAVKER